MTNVNRAPSANPTSDLRRWMRIQYVVLVVWAVAIVVALNLGVDLIVVGAFILISSYAIWFLVDPRKSWWGPGLRSALADPAAFRRYQLRMSIAMVVVLLVVTVAMSALGVSAL